MFYFSTIFGVRVHDKNDEFLGYLDDLIIESNRKNYPPVVGILIKDKKNKCNWFVPSTKIVSWSTDAIILNTVKAEALENVPDKPELLFLHVNILDKQIVDLSGVKVVRVNDLQFGTVKGNMSLLAMDVSTSGLFRRLGFKKPFLHLFKPHLLEWKDVHLIGDKLQLAIGKEHLVKLHPADIANIIERLNLRHGSQLLKSLDEVTAAKVMEEIQPSIQKLLVQHLGVERSTDIMSKMSTDELVDLIQLLPAHEAKKVIEGLPINKDVYRVKKILEYEDDEAGGLMTTEYLTTHPDSTVKEVIQKVKEHSHMHRSILFVYVVDINNVFKGVVSLRRLITADNQDKVKNIMKHISRVPAIKVDTELAEIANVMTKYNLLSVAVVDAEEKMLGIVTIDDIMRCFLPEA